VDAIKKHVPLLNKVCLASNGWTSMNKLAITLVNAYNMDQNWALREVQLDFDQVDRLFYSSFVSELRMIGEGPTNRSKDNCTFGGRA
jgi:hypothetical protein